MSAAAVIQRACETQGWSRDKIAAEFVRRYRFKAPDKKRNARSFAAEIRKLEAGDPTWFERRPPAAALIAEILESTPVELGISSGDDIVSFVDFPEIRSLDLATEDPFAIERWLPLLDEAVSRPVWFSAEAGVGKTLFARWAERRGLAMRITGATLASVEQQAAEMLATLGPARLLIIDVARVEQSDLGAQQRLARAKLIVLAPEPRPQREAPEPGPTGDDRAAPWKDYTFATTAFDRRRFVDWLAHRLPEGHGVADRLWRKLAEIDPNGSLIATPDDVIQFLGAVFEKRGMNVLDAIVARAARRSSSHWIVSHGRKVFRALALQRWFDTRFPYARPVPRETWEGYLSSDLVAPRDREAIRAALEAARVSSANLDEVADRLVLDRSSVITLLEDVRLLVRSGDGLLSLHPQWLAHVQVLEQVRGLIASDPKRACGTAVDMTRRAVLDDMLASADAELWRGFLNAAVKCCKDDDLGSIAVVESAFAAIARRHERGLYIKQPRALEAILSRQIELLVSRHEGGPPGPVTRPGPNFTGGVQFVADCWTWSAAITKPASVRVPETWLFPGWEPRALPQLPPWIGGLDVVGSLDAPERVRKTFTKFITRWSPQHWTNIPTWLWLVLVQAAEEWPIDPSQATVMVQNERAASELLRRLEQMDAELASRVIRRLWTLGSHLDLWSVVALLKGPLGPRLRDAFDPELVERALPRWGPAIPTDLGQVPLCLRGALVRWVLDNDPGKAHLLASQASHLDGGDHGLIVRLAEYPMGWLAIDHLWQVAPEAARRVLADRLARNQDVAHWLEGPPSAMPAILDLVEGVPPSETVRRWAMRRLLNQPWLADRLWALARRASDSITASS